MAQLRCDACGGDTFEPTAEPGFFRCHNCGAASWVKLASPAVGSGTGIVLASVGPKKIQVIKVLREYTGWDLKKAKDLTDAAEHAPQVIQLGAGDPAILDRMATDLAAAGATVQRS